MSLHSRELHRYTQVTRYEDRGEAALSCGNFAKLYVIALYDRDQCIYDFILVHCSVYLSPVPFPRYSKIHVENRDFYTHHGRLS